MPYLRRVLTGGALLALLLLVTARAPFWHAPLAIAPAAGEWDRDAEARDFDAAVDARGEEEVAEDRASYYHMLLRDPATGEIPEGIRALEVAYARTLPVNDGFSKAGVPLFNWIEAGPRDVGGRTRALAADVRNPSIALAAGVSGGIWKTSDGGASWRQVSDPLQALNVVSLAQDVRAGQQDTWYAVTGEAQNNTASDRGFVARYEGKGIYKSTDNGNAWTQVVPNPGNPTVFDAASQGLDYALRVAVSPTTGTVFYCSYFFGLFRSTNGGASFQQAFGGVNQHVFCDVAAAPDGSLLLGVSSPPSGGTAQRTPGAYRSTDDGVTWTQVGAGTITSSFNRVVVAIAPSDPTVGYFYVATGTGSNTPLMYRLNLAAGTAVDRSANLPTNRTTALALQGGYNMVVAVKPDDPNFVVYGATSLFRTRDGFATAAGTGQSPEYWIGGYQIGTSFAQYPNHHPDQHVVYFEPGSPNRMWSGHDGGLSRTQNVAALGMVTWDDLNNGYNVTQMYTVAQPEEAGDNRITGGTQDNGTPLFNQAGDPTVLDISTGDGSYAAFISDRRVFSSSQQGRVLRLKFDSETDNLTAIAYVAPTGAFKSDGTAKAQLFVHPFVVDPSSDIRMVYPEGDSLWRNNNLPAIPDNSACCSTTIGWQKLDAVLPSGYVVSTLELSRNPAGRLYYAGFTPAGITPGVPRLFRVDNVFGQAASTDQDPSTNGGAVELTLPGVPVGAYIHDIAVNPLDANEVMVVLSNYNIEGLYYSADGGANWTIVEGNLEGNSTTPGPSLRSAQILNYNGRKVFLVGTSTGLFATTTLAGDGTVWERQNPEGIGLYVVESVSARPSDGRVLAGTHGRGVFEGRPGPALPVELTAASEALLRVAPPAPNPATGPVAFRFNLGAAARVSLRVYDAAGREVAVLADGTPYGAGLHALTFNTRTLAPGLYAYRVLATAGATPEVKSGRLVVVR